MSNFKTKDNVSIYYKDWGEGQPIVFSHGWPLSGDAWENQMLFLASQGYRVIAHDRRGHGRSEQPWTGNDMDTFADDLSQLINTLELESAVLVGHSMGGGDITRYIGRHGTNHIAGIALVSAVTPGLLKTEKNPKGIPLEVFDGLRTNLQNDRPQFYKDLTATFFGANRKESKVSQGIRDTFWLLGMQGSVKSQFDCIKAFSETDFTEDLKKFDKPTLVIHGDDDQIVPLAITAQRVPEFVKHAEVKVYPEGDHGLPTTYKEQINSDLLAFIKKCSAK